MSERSAKNQSATTEARNYGIELKIDQEGRSQIQLEFREGFARDLGNFYHTTLARKWS